YHDPDHLCSVARRDLELPIMGWNIRTLLSLSLLLFSVPALAYPTPVDFDGARLRWPIERTDSAILYEVVSDSADISFYEQAVIEAADMWTNVRSSYFAYAQAGEGEKAQVTVHPESSLQDWPFSAGYAIFDKVSKNGEPVHCEIYIGLNVHDSYLSLAKTALHELGHCLGLGHSLVPQAIMGYQMELNNFELDVDDQAALSRLYPADGS